MTGASHEDRWEAELRQLRQELGEMRAEQRELAHAVEQLTATFRAIATHLGIAAEPYPRRGGDPPDRNLPGFA